MLLLGCRGNMREVLCKECGFPLEWDRFEGGYIQHFHYNEDDSDLVESPYIGF